MSNVLVDELYKKLLSGMSDDAAGPNFTVLESPTRPIDRNTLSALSGNQTAGEASLELELFSNLVDGDLPTMNRHWQSSGITLTDLYSLILGARTGAGPVTTMLADARKVFDAMKLGSLIQPTVNFHPSWPAPADFASEEGEHYWSRLSLAHDSQSQESGHALGAAASEASATYRASSLSKSWPDFVAAGNGEPGKSPDAFSGTDIHLQKSPSANLGSGRSVIPRGIPAFETLSGSSLKSLLGNYGSPVGLTPIHGPDGPLAPPPQLDPFPLNPFPKPKHPLPWPEPGSGTPFPWPSTTPTIKNPFLPNSPAPSHGGATATPPADSLSLSYMRVSIVRRWLNTLVATFPGLRLDGIAPGYFSDGRGTGNQGRCPLIPISFIVIKDLRIQGDWSDEDARDIESRLLNGDGATFGPFTIAARGMMPGKFDGSTLSVPGMTILAWQCRVFPELPAA